MRLKESELSAALSPDDGVVVLSKQDYEDAISLIGRSFAGTASTAPELVNDWMLGPHLQQRDDPVRNETETFFMALACDIDFPTCTLLGVRAANGRLIAVLAVRRVSQRVRESGCLDLMKMTLSVIRRGQPSVFKDKAYKHVRGGLEKRGTAADRLMKTMHNATVRGPHLHLNLLATEPLEQGRGHGSKLLRAFSRLCDSTGLPAYLDCGGDANKAIYGKYGFQLIQTYTLSCASDPDATQWPPYDQYHAMLRPAKAGAALPKPAHKSAAVHPAMD
jgi:GNAT superfamily N-acetyltransferase